MRIACPSNEGLLDVQGTQAARKSYSEPQNEQEWNLKHEALWEMDGDWGLMVIHVGTNSSARFSCETTIRDQVLLSLSEIRRHPVNFRLTSHKYFG